MSASVSTLTTTTTTTTNWREDANLVSHTITEHVLGNFWHKSMLIAVIHFKQLMSKTNKILNSNTFLLTIQLQQQLHCYWSQPRLSHCKCNTVSSIRLLILPIINVELRTQDLRHSWTHTDIMISALEPNFLVTHFNIGLKSDTPQQRWSVIGPKRSV